MLNSVTFFNKCNNGDIHVSRTFVRDLMLKVVARTYRYAHKNSKRLLLDIPNLQTIPSIDYPDIEVTRTNDDVVISTWYHTAGGRYNQRWCHFDVLWKLFSTTYERLHLPVPTNKIDYLPYIDYSKYHLDGIKKFFNARGGRPSVLFVNSAAFSGQAANFDMSPAIIELSRKHPNYDFLVTNKCPAIGSNVFYTSEIIGLNDNDLNENSYISTLCRVIVGRSTGAFTFSLTKDNLLDPNKTFIGLTNVASAVQWCDEAKCKAIICNGDNAEIIKTVNQVL